ncbi:MAG: hypothetical protein M4579_006394 [Chaenotheca gracillima]|nr:MAG: hypothetical protein M4579_006394 [Chaenotheca gracillima]
MPSKTIEGVENGDFPVTKRQKLVNGSSSHLWARQQSSRIFAPFRSIGLVSPTSTPFTSIPLGKTTFQVTTSTGTSLQTYDLRKGLNLVFATKPQTPQTITATASWKDRVFAAWAGGASAGVWVYKRGKMIEELESKDILDEPIQKLLIFGSWIVGCCFTKIQVWKSATYEHYTTITPMRSGSTGGFTLTGAICNMPTYLNKIFVGREDGNVEIWNLSTGKLLYTMLPPGSDDGAVSALEPTPALSLLAIAYSDGPILIRDVRMDKTIIRLNAGSLDELPVTSLSFRTDSLGAGDDGSRSGILATSALGSGDVTFWDLNNGGRVVGKLRGAHDPPSAASDMQEGGINKVEFLAGQPVLVTSGLDNSLKTWIFDETPFSPVPRPLHSRGGHAAPVTCLEFLPSDADGVDAGGKWLLSAAKDRSFWGWSLRRDGQSTELSQGNIRKKAKKIGMFGNSNGLAEGRQRLEDLKAPEITCIAVSLNRDGGMGASPGEASVWANNRGSNAKKKGSDASASSTTGWESVVTGHSGDKFARTWFWGRKRAGRWTFSTGDKAVVRSVTISPCGTFAVVGSEMGGIDTFNLQSGLHRQRFPQKMTLAQAKTLQFQQETALSNIGDRPSDFLPGQGKHNGAVTGLAVDSTNKALISCGLDGKVKFWNFNFGTLVDEIDFGRSASALSLRYHRPSDLIAFACSDQSIRVVDIETKKIVREFGGTLDQVTDFCFSNDGRWIVAATEDCLIRVWDLPTGHLIDAIRLRSKCNALAFSNTGEFLATAHADSVGVNIWNNRALFTHVPTRNITEAEVIKLIAPDALDEDREGLLEAAFEEDEEAIDTTFKVLDSANVDQLSKEIETLSLVPKSRWQTLLHLDQIKERNKPREPPKAPEKAPFFLSALENKKPDPQKGDKQDSLVEKSRIMKMNRAGAESPFTVLLRQGSDTGDYNPFIENLKLLPPAAADLEIRSLDPTESSSELVNFIQALTSRLRQKMDYELVQTWLNVFLRLHGDLVETTEGLVEALREWRLEQEREAQRLGSLTGYCSGVISFLRSSRT